MKTQYPKTVSLLLQTVALTLVVFIMTSCVEKPELDRKKAELAEAKAKLAELTEQVKKLESEIKAIDPAKANDMKTLTVATAVLQPTTLNHYLELQGSIEAENNVMVNAKMGGVVTKVYVREGQAVRAGQVLAETDNSTMIAGLAEAKTQLELVNTLYEKQAKLWEQKIGSEIQYIQAKSNKEAVENRIKTLESQIALSRITSPISGAVDAVMVKEGETAAPGFGVFRVVNTSDVKATAKVADSYVDLVDEGKPVEIILPDLNQTLNSKVTFVSRTVDPLSRTLTIESKLAGASAKVRPNMIAVLKVNDMTLSNVLVVDENLIQNTEKGKILFVKGTKGNKTVAVERIVVTGLSYGGQVEIKSGLQPGDELITAGSQDLVDGQPIAIDNIAATR